MCAINDSISDTIIEYRRSRQMLRDRIRELNRQIYYITQNSKAPCGGLKALTERRQQLYAMTWDLDYGIRQMLEYVHNTGERNEVSYAG